MNIAYHCPQCQGVARAEVVPEQAVTCSACGAEIAPPAEAFESGQLRRCLVCPSADLFVRKDFPVRLGVGIVVIGFVASSITWAYYWPIATYGILFVTALIDLGLYLVVPDALMCYRCGAQYRMAPGMERHGAFNLETHERHRQQAARVAGGR